jgi:hypothetical protein
MSDFEVRDDVQYMSTQEKLCYLAASASVLDEVEEQFSSLHEELDTIKRKHDKDAHKIVHKQMEKLREKRDISESMIRILKRDFNGKAIIILRGGETSVVFVSGERISILSVAAVVDSLSSNQSPDMLDEHHRINKHRSLSSLVLQDDVIEDIQSVINRLESLDAKTALRDVFGITNIIPMFHFFESEIIKMGVSNNIVMKHDSIENIYASLLLDAILQILKSSNFPLSP